MYFISSDTTTEETVAANENICRRELALASGNMGQIGLEGGDIPV